MAASLDSAKHTPGPWSVPHMARPEVDCDCVYVLANGYMGSVADISVYNGKPIGEGGNDSPPLAEAQANARLIAAAPDLLEALQELHEIFNGLVGSANYPKQVKKTRAAIAKALGK
jgi:hypothetical protein